MALKLSVYATEPAFFAAAGNTAATDVSGSRVDGQRFLFGFMEVLVMTRSYVSISFSEMSHGAKSGT